MNKKYFLDVKYDVETGKTHIVMVYKNSFNRWLKRKKFVMFEMTNDVIIYSQVFYDYVSIWREYREFMDEVNDGLKLIKKQLENGEDNGH